IRLSGHAVGTEIAIRINGPRRGEKLVEELRAPSERAEPTAHPSILRLIPVPLPGDRLDDGILQLTELASCRRDDDVSRVLFELVVTAPTDSESLVDLAAMERSELWSPSNS
ncbi:MAG TPA: polysaccharide biosynthesis protein, partial [Acidimicrobiia bacterium]